MKQIGAGFKQTNRALRRDPQFGNQIVETFKGDFTQLQLKADLLRSSGLRTELDRGDGVSTLTVWGAQADVGTEVPIDRWELASSARDVSIYEHPKIFKDFWKTKARKLIEDSVDAGSETAPTVENATSSLVQMVHWLRGGNVETYPERVPVLSRSRSYSIAYQSRISIPSFSTPAYTTSNLNSTFNVPSLIQTQLPADPAADHTPADHTWAWRLMDDSMAYDRHRNTVEEFRLWEFWYWNNDFYAIQS